MCSSPSKPALFSWRPKIYSFSWDDQEEDDDKKIIEDMSSTNNKIQAHLYLDPDSHPSRAVEMVARMIGSNLERHYLDLMANDQFSPYYLELNPLHRVPFLVDGDLKLGESRTIMRYLADRDLPQDNTLYPHDLKERAEIDEILDLDSGTLCTLIYELFGPKFFGLSDELDKRGEFKFREILHYLEHRLRLNGDKKYLLSDHITIADIALVASLSLPDICEYDFTIFPKLDEYIQRLSNSIPQYKEVNENGLNKYRNLMKVMQG